MSLSIRLLVPVLLLGLCVPFAGADDDELVRFAAEDLIATQKDLPKGWKMLDDDVELPVGMPSEDTLLELGGQKVDALALTVERRVLGGPEGRKAVVAIVDVDANRAEYTAALETYAGANEWTVAPIGHPQRLLVVAAAETDRAMLLEWQRRLGAEKLVGLAFDEVRKTLAGGRPTTMSIEKAEEYLAAAGKLVPASGAVSAMSGMLEVFKDDLDAGFVLIRAGLDRNADLPPSPELEVFVAGNFGSLLLVKKDPKLDKEALTYLRRAVGLDEKNRSDRSRYGNRYNLTCALARVGQTDEAFAELEKSLELGRFVLGREYILHFRHAWFWDEDMEPLRADPRFAEVTKKFAPEGFDFVKEREAQEKEKQRRADEEAKQKAAREKEKEGEGDDESGDGMGG